MNRFWRLTVTVALSGWWSFIFYCWCLYAIQDGIYRGVADFYTFFNIVNACLATYNLNMYLLRRSEVRKLSINKNRSGESNPDMT